MRKFQNRAGVTHTVMAAGDGVPFCRRTLLHWIFAFALAAGLAALAFWNASPAAAQTNDDCKSADVWCATLTAGELSGLIGYAAPLTAILASAS